MNKFKIRTTADSYWGGTDFEVHADRVDFEMSGAVVFHHQNDESVPILAVPPGAWRSVEFIGAVTP